MADFKDPFQNVSSADFEAAPYLPEEKSEPQPTENEPPKKAIKTGGHSAFRPASASTNHDTDSIQAFNEDDIFEFAENAFKEKVASAKSDAKPNFVDTPQQKQVKELVDPDTIEITSVMYVEILEAVTIILCEWVSGLPNPVGYAFKKSLKERYEKVSALLIQAENIAITPMHLFLLMTILLVGGSVWRAYGDKKKRIKKETAAKKINMAQQKGSDILEQNSIDAQRSNFTPRIVDGVAYYDKDPFGKYAKKGELEEIPPEISAFIFEHKKNKGVWPSKTDIEKFLKS